MSDSAMSKRTRTARIRTNQARTALARTTRTLAVTAAIALVPVLAAPAASAAPADPGSSSAAYGQSQGKGPRGNEKRPCWKGVQVGDWQVPERCSSVFPESYRYDFGLAGNVYAPEFDITFAPYKRTGFAYAFIGDTPVGWAEFGPDYSFLVLEGPSDRYQKGEQVIAFYDPRGRLVAWDLITMNWDW